MTTVPDDDATREPLRLPLSPIAADRVRGLASASAALGALALVAAASAGTTPMLLTTLALALALAWGWPVVGGSHTPTATSVVLAVAAVGIVASAARDDLQWVAAAVALGIVLSFFAQLLRRTGRDGLVLTLLASFGGLVLVASGTTAVVVVDTERGEAVVVVCLVAAACAVVADVLAPVRPLGPFLGLVALAAAVAGALLAASWVESLGAWSALGIGAAAGSLSWSFRRVLALAPALLTARGQVGCGVGSVLAVGAVAHVFSVL